MTRKHLPTRTCIACRRIKPKQDLIRIVRNPDGNIELDKSGKANGRGGYLCKNHLCWNRALKKRATLLKRTLRVDFNRETYLGLKKFAMRYKPEEEKQAEETTSKENQVEGEHAEGAPTTEKTSDASSSSDSPSDTPSDSQSDNNTNKQAATQKKNLAQNATEEKKEESS